MAVMLRMPSENFNRQIDLDNTWIRFVGKDGRGPGVSAFVWKLMIMNL